MAWHTAIKSPLILFLVCLHSEEELRNQEGGGEGWGGALLQTHLATSTLRQLMLGGHYILIGNLINKSSI